VASIYWREVLVPSVSFIGGDLVFGTNSVYNLQSVSHMTAALLREAVAAYRQRELQIMFDIVHVLNKMYDHDHIGKTSPTVCE
jgi:hypothetical protein